MSKILNLSKDNWEKEIRDSDLSETTKQLLIRAVQARVSDQKYPYVSEEGFNAIIGQVYFIRLGPIGLILEKSKRGGQPTLSLRREDYS